MPIKDIQVEVITQSDGGSFKPSDLVAENLYECVISSVSEGEATNYKTGNKEKVIDIEFTILEGEHKDKKLVKQARPKIGAGYEGGSPSTLYQIIYSVYRGLPDQPMKELINSLEGKRIKVMVKNKNGKKNGKPYSTVKDFLSSSVEQKSSVPVVQIDEDSLADEIPF